MDEKHSQVRHLQQLVLDIIKIERNHRIPETERRENVVEHSFSVAVLAWKIFDEIKPNLDLSLILRYALAHDFAERGQAIDVNTFAPNKDREDKKIKEALEIEKISQEFMHFSDLISTLQNYEKQVDEESVFVWSADKMQHLLLGEIDDWRPYKIAGVSYDQFCDKYDEIISKCSPYLKEIFEGVYAHARETYYDEPQNKS